MTPDELIALLTSPRAADRRAAARQLLASPTLVERELIQVAFHSEPVPQIRQQLSAALELIKIATTPAIELPADQVKTIHDEAYLKAVRHVTERILHQFNPLIGDIEQAASGEIDEYDRSRTKMRVGQLKLQAAAITKLYNAAKTAVVEEFDLSVVIRNCLPDDLELKKCSVSFVGPPQLLVQTDPSLITIAVTNGLRNAIEASICVATESLSPTIIVNWGATDRDYWVSVLDEGLGYTGNISGAFEIGTSTKGHGGHGLPATKSAMISLSGTVDLVPQNDRGCSFNLTWPIISTREILG